MGVVVAGRLESIPGVRTRSWADEPVLWLLAGDREPRRGVPQLIVLHTVHGTRVPRVLPGAGPRGEAERWARSWANAERASGAHLVVDFDGSVGCTADLLLSTAYHARQVNHRSIGIEVAQRDDGSIYRAQLRTVLHLVDWLTIRFAIQRGVCWPYRGPVQRLVDGGFDCVGVCGHRDTTNDRGRGDPGDEILGVLAASGRYEAMDWHAGHDLRVWRERQRAIRSPERDGVPRLATARALATAGYVAGQWTLGWSPLQAVVGAFGRAV